jgi:cytoplasmic iron level regulating protein YaaA (DUF328/UPF0246 family)
MSLYLVSCVSKKLVVPAPAKDLYTSPLFLKARAYVESLSQPWHILSAKYGLVHPEQVIDPYDLTLKTMGVADRRRWAERVMSQLQQHLDGVGEVVFLAGMDYRKFLEPQLVAQGIKVAVPMQRLKIGEQLSWLGRRTHG